MIRILAAAALFAAAPAMAQSSMTQSSMTQAAASQAAVADDHAAHAAHAEAQARLSLDTPIETVAADAKGKAVLDAVLPGLTSHEHYPMFKGMTLNQLAPMAGGMMPAEALAKIQAELAAIE